MELVSLNKENELNHFIDYSKESTDCTFIRGCLWTKFGFQTLSTNILFVCVMHTVRCPVVVTGNSSVLRSYVTSEEKLHSKPVKTEPVLNLNLPLPEDFSGREKKKWEPL
jgi:hypothetical protein